MRNWLRRLIIKYKMKEGCRMGMLKELKLKNTCKKEGRMDEYVSYSKRLEDIKTDIIMYRENMSKATEKLANIQKNFHENTKEYIDAKNKVNEWKQALEERELELKFIRPNSQEDIDYRNRQYDNFTDELQSVLSSNLDMRFHGTSIYFAEQIIKSGTISSSADRYDGYIKSTDRKGEISVSNKQTLGITIRGWFSDLGAYRRCLPAGCVFALFPKDKEDATLGYNIIHSVDFRQNPQQLFGVFTTPENIEQVKGWMNEAGFNPNSVYTFEGFLENVKTKSNIIDEKISARSNVTELENGRINDKSNYLFGEEQAKEMALEKGESGRKIGKLAKLQEKIKNVMKELKNKFNVAELNKGKGDIESGEDRD